MSDVGMPLLSAYALQLSEMNDMTGTLIMHTSHESVCSLEILFFGVFKTDSKVPIFNDCSAWGSGG